MQSGNYHFILVLIVFAFSGLSWVIGKLREQGAVKKARDEARRANDEHLRTGRVVEAPKPTRTSELAELRELAMKRQQQIQQIRELQKRGTQGQQTRLQNPGRLGSVNPMPMPGMPRIPGGPGIPLPSPRSIQTRPTSPGVPTLTMPGGGRILDIRPPQQGQRAKSRQPQRPVEDDADVRPAYEVVQPARRRLVSDAPDDTNSADAFTEKGGRRTGPLGLTALLGGTGGGRPTASDMRRAIILSEVLSSPVGSRPPTEA